MINSAVDTAHWEIITKWEGSDYLRYALQKNTEEFSKTLTFDFNKKDKKYTIEDFFVIFKKDLLQYTVYMTKDTVYYLKEPLDELRPIFELGKKSFIKGKYNYQMRYGTLDPGQRRYYLVHMDSLKSITGDELPKLPVIEESDSIWFKYSNEEK